MKIQELLKKVQGYTRIEDLQKELNVNRARAIYLIHRLRKKGYVETRYLSNKKRRYYVARENLIGGIRYVDTLNTGTPTGLQLVTADIHRIYGRTPSAEETFIYAIQQKRVRWILASLGLFRRIDNWARLYQLAKKHGLVRAIAALYDVARISVPKVRRMPQRFKTLAKPKKGDEWKYIIDKFDSRDLQNIEKKWKVYIPLNQADLNDVRFEYALRKAQHAKKGERRVAVNKNWIQHD